MLKKILLIAFFSIAAGSTLLADNGWRPIKRCCTDAQAYDAWNAAGADREWRDENITDSSTIYRRSDYRQLSFTDVSELPAIAGFEQSVYTSPK